MTTTELRYWETPEYREKYSDDDRKAMAKKGHAMPDGSYPIADQEDLDNAIHAVGRGGDDHNAIRKHIMARAHDLGHGDMIPENWNADGSLRADESDTEERSTNPALVAAAERRKKERHRAVQLLREVRFYEPTDLEVRREAKADTDEIIITGAPIVYGASYTVRDFFGEFEETIHRGAVDALLAKGVDCRLLLNHEGLAMARTASGTMQLIDTPDRLTFRARLDARQQLANDFAIAIERGDMNQMSVGMVVGRDNWGYNKGSDMETRDIFALNDLLDVSGVTYPCSPTTHIEVAQRMMMAVPLESRARLRQMEVELRAGKVLSGASQAKLLAAIGALHDLADAGGIDPAEYGPDTDSDDGVATEDDGSDGVGNDEAPGITYPDGSGGRASDDPEVEEREDEEAEAEEAEVETRDDSVSRAAALRAQALRAAARKRGVHRH